MGHTDHPDITDFVPQTNYASQKSVIVIHSFLIIFHHIKLIRQILLQNQTTRHYIMYNPLLILPDPESSLHHLKQKKISNSKYVDFTDFDNLYFATETQNSLCYTKILLTRFRIRLKHKTQLITQRPSKVTIHFLDKLNALLKEKHIFLKQMVLLLTTIFYMEITYLNHPIFLLKGDSFKCVLDPRHLNSNQD